MGKAERRRRCISFWNFFRCRLWRQSTSVACTRHEKHTRYVLVITQAITMHPFHISILATSLLIFLITRCQLCPSRVGLSLRSPIILMIRYPLHSLERTSNLLCSSIQLPFHSSFPHSDCICRGVLHCL